MATTSQPELPATQRLYEALPLAPGWTGLLLALGLTGLFLALEAAGGRFEALARAEDPEPYRDFRLAIVNVVLMAYLPTAYTVVTSRARRGAEALAPLLAGGGRAEVAAVGRYPAGLRWWAGGIGIAAALALPVTGMLAGLPFPYDVHLWTQEVVWHRVTAVVIGWWVGLLVLAVVSESARFSRLALALREIDLLDLRPLSECVGQGLTHALALAGLGGAMSLFLLETGFGAMIAVVFLAIIPIATGGLLLPARGARERIRRARESELAWLRDAQRRARARLGDENASGAGRMADLVAYRSQIESIPEWPFDTAAWLRFLAYLLIPLGSWAGGAFVERWIDVLLD